MKAKKAVIAIAAAALVICLILITMRAFYVLIAIVAGTLIMGHRELWAIIKTGKMPPMDERVKANTGKAIRNGFVFFAVASIALMLTFSVNRSLNVAAVHVASGLFLSCGAAYLLSYLFYDRSEPNLGERALKLIRTFLVLAGTSVAVFIISFFLHNITGRLLGFEEAVFFIIAVIISPLAFATGIVGCLAIFIKGLASQPPDRLSERETE